MRARGTRQSQSLSKPDQTFTIVSVLLFGCLLGFSISRSLQQPLSRTAQTQCLCHESPCEPSVLPHATEKSGIGSQNAVSRQHEVLPARVASQGSMQELLKSKFSRLPSLSEIPAGSDVFLTFSNGHYSKLMLNAAALVADLGFPIVVLTFDQAAQDTCTEYNIPSIRSSVQMDTADFRQDRYVDIPRWRGCHTYQCSVASVTISRGTELAVNCGLVDDTGIFASYCTCTCEQAAPFGSAFPPFGPTCNNQNTAVA